MRTECKVHGRKGRRREDEIRTKQQRTTTTTTMTTTKTKYGESKAPGPAPLAPAVPHPPQLFDDYFFDNASRVSGQSPCVVCLLEATHESAFLLFVRGLKRREVQVQGLHELHFRFLGVHLMGLVPCLTKERWQLRTCCFQFAFKDNAWHPVFNCLLP